MARPSAKEHICYHGKLPTESKTDNTVFGIGNRDTRESHSSGLYSVDDILDIMTQFRKLEPSKYPEPIHSQYTYEDIQSIADILNDTLYEIQDDEGKPYEPDAEGQEQLDELELCKGDLAKRAKFFFDYLARQDARNNLDNVNENVEFKYEYIPQLRTHPLWSVITRESDIPLDQSSLELHRLSPPSSPTSPSWGSPIRSAESSAPNSPVVRNSPRIWDGGSKKKKTIKKRSGRKVGGSKKKKSSPKPKTKISNKNKRSGRTRRNNKKGGGARQSTQYKNDIEKLQTDISLFKQFISNSQSEANILRAEISKKEKKCPKVKGRPVKCYNVPIDELKIKLEVENNIISHYQQTLATQKQKLSEVSKQYEEIIEKGYVPV